MVAAPLVAENCQLSDVQERVARYLAAGALTQAQIAKRCKVADRTIRYWRDELPAMQARIRQLRDQFRATAMDDAPFADKRLRVVSRDALARDTLATLKETNYEETYYYGPDALEAKRFDAGRVEAFRKYLNDIAEEMGDRGTGRGQSISVNVGVAVALDAEERVGRLASLLARIDVTGD